MKRTFKINGQTFKSVNGVKGALAAYNRKNKTTLKFKQVTVKVIK